MDLRGTLESTEFHDAQRAVRLWAGVLRTVRVTAPARLHLGFLDLNADLGRRFGSLGLAIDRPATRLTLREARGLQVRGPEATRAARLLEKLGADDVALDIEEAIPAHAGLGSGTQLALAIGAAYRLLRGNPDDRNDPGALANLLGRGQRSGIGLAAFIDGGLVLDGGRGLADSHPPILSRLDFPKAWRILLVLDPAIAGLSGPAEAGAFRDAPPFAAETAAHLCRLTVMKALPGAAEGDLEAFGSAVAEIQRVVGDHFAGRQGGGRFTSPEVGSVLSGLAAKGFHVGQTSWGPTGYAFFAEEDEARRMCKTLADADVAGLTFLVCRGRNRGADIE